MKAEVKRKFKCWKEDKNSLGGIASKRYIHKNKNFVINTRLGGAGGIQVCIIDKKSRGPLRDSKCYSVKKNIPEGKTSKDMIIKRMTQLMEEHNKC